MPARAAEERGILNIQVENDLFVNPGTSDKHYTNGFRVSWLSLENDVPNLVHDFADLVPVFAADGKLRVSYSFGQNMFTPGDITKSEPQPRDRPYAGWLYAGVGLVSDSGETLDNLELNVGVVGPWSLAEPIQRAYHDMINTTEPRGWDNQLHNEPGVVLFYERQWRRLREFETFGFGVDMTPHVGAAVGNVYTYGATGVTFRVGRNLPADYGPPRIRPSLPGSGFFLGSDGFGWYLFAGVEGRAVGRDIFLDGNTFEASQNVDKKNFVADGQAGIAMTIDDVRIAFTYVYRTTQFHGQEAPDSFGALSVSFRF